MHDDVDLRAEQAKPGYDHVRAPGEALQHPRRSLDVLGLAVDPPVESNRRVDAERHATSRMNRVRLSLRMHAHELGRLEIGEIALDVRRRHHLERDPQLLEDRPPLRAGGGEDQPVLRATHRSSAGHLLAHSGVAVS